MLIDIRVLPKKQFIFTMSKEFTVPKNLQYNFNGSTISFRPKPEYKAQSQNKLLKFNQLMMPNFQNIKKSQLERQNQNFHQNQTIKLANKNETRTPFKDSKYQPNSSYYSKLQQSKKNVLGLEKNIVQKRHQSQLEKFLAKQNQNLMEHRHFLTSQVRKYQTKANKYRFKYRQYRQKVRALQQQNQVWKMKFQEMKSYVFNSNAQSYRLQSSMQKGTGFESTGVDYSRQEPFKTSKTSYFFHQKHNCSLNLSKVQVNDSQYYQTNEKPRFSMLQQLNDQFDACMYDYKVRKDPNCRKKCIQLAKQIQLLSLRCKQRSNSTNKENKVPDGCDSMVIDKAQRFLRNESVCQIDQKQEKVNSTLKFRQELSEITQDQHKINNANTLALPRNLMF